MDDRLDDLDPRLGAGHGLVEQPGRQDGVRESRAQLRDAQRAGAEVVADVPVLVAVDEHLGRRDGGEAERRRLADRGLLEQERGGPDRHQVEEALVDLDREVRAGEVALHPLRSVLEERDQRRALGRRHLVPGPEAEPARPGRGQLGQQARRQLVDCIRCGAVEESLVVAPRLAELRAEPVPALRQRVGVALAPERLPGLTA